MRGIFYISLIVVFLGCVENYQFPINENEKLLVVEGYVSNVSYNDIGSLRFDPRYFEVKLKYSSPVTNQRDEMVSDAQVELVDDRNEHWDYFMTQEGIYTLYFEQFKAEPGRAYKLSITLNNGEIYESEFEQMPLQNELGTVYLEETQKHEYVRAAGEWQIQLVDGFELKVKFDDELIRTETEYLKWDFITTYGFIARLNPTYTDPNKKCWITSIYHNQEYLLEENSIGGEFPLFFRSLSETKLLDDYSTLIRQQSLSKNYNQYWADVQKQAEQSELFAPPPYNVSTNLKCINEDKVALGYFGVVNERYYRWIFSFDQLSAAIPYPESLTNSCNIPMPPPSCRNCMQAELSTGDQITNTKQAWWFE